VLKINARVAAISILPLLGLIGFASLSIAQHWQEMTSAKALRRDTAVAVSVGHVVHELQAERGLSTAFISSGSGAAELVSQRGKVDRVVTDLGQALADPRAQDNADLGVAVEQFEDTLGELTAIRRDVDASAGPAPALAGRYTSLIGSGMKIIGVTSRDAAALSAEAGRALVAYAALGRAKEQAGRERAAGVVTTSSATVTAPALIGQASLSGAQTAELENVARHLPAQHATAWERLQQGPEFGRVSALREQLSAAVGAPPPFGPNEWFKAATQRIDAMRGLQLEIAKEVDRISAEEHAAAQAGLTLSAIIALLAALGALAAAFFAGRSITQPLAVLTRDMDRLAAGDKTVKVEAARRRDEIGEMGRAVLVFKNSAVELDRATEEKARLDAETSAERARNESERAARAAEQEHVVNGLAAGLRDLSEGDLTARLTSSFAAEYEQLRTDFNSAMEKLQVAMGTVVTNVSGIRSSASEISDAAGDLSKRTEQQAASVEETAAALDQITAMVRRAAEGAKQANSVVAGARVDAEASGEVVRNSVAAMGEIEKSSEQISQIIGVIDEIAFQTNLLALNAGVEAARAGDAGKGFAVVASEVRALAQRSSEAAKEIKDLIAVSTRHVETGVRLVGEAGDALSTIAAKVAGINSLVSEITASAEEQATGLAQVNTAINQIDQVTQQNAAMVEQSTAASQSLTLEAEELMQLVSRFRTGEKTEGALATRAA
jgi:methyl-accepting chemotaxis protein